VILLDFGNSSVSNLVEDVSKRLKFSHGQIFFGITAVSASYQSALEVARSLKDIIPHSIVFLGGPHSTVQDDVILRHNKCIDYVIRGEGERATEQLLRSYPDIYDVPNLTYRCGTQIRRNPLATLLNGIDLDQILPAESWSCSNSGLGKFGRMTYVSSRGCSRQCAFCAVGTGQTRFKSVKAVARDLQILIEEMGFQELSIEDNFFAQSPRRAIDVCYIIERLQETRSFKWDCQTRVESCEDFRVIESLERASCDQVYLGLESLSCDKLKYLEKARRPHSYIDSFVNRVVPRLLQSRIPHIAVNLQFGLPDESPVEFAETLRVFETLGNLALKYQKQMKVCPQLHVVYPGTRLFQRLQAQRQFGLTSDTVFERFTLWEKTTRCFRVWMGENFAHGTGGIPVGILNTNLLSKGEFAIEEDAIHRISEEIRSLAQLPGLKVLDYGSRLSATA